MALSYAAPADPVTGAGFPAAELFCGFPSLQSEPAAQQRSLPCSAASAPGYSEYTVSSYV